MHLMMIVSVIVVLTGIIGLVWYFCTRGFDEEPEAQIDHDPKTKEEIE